MGISPRTAAVGGRAVCIVWPTVIGSFHRFNSTNSLALFWGPHYKYHQKRKKKVVIEGMEHPVSAQL